MLGAATLVVSALLMSALLVSAPAVPPARAAADEPPGAEFAIRWNVADGGPATLFATLAALKSRGTRPRTFTNQYYDLPAAPATPEGFAAVLRRRTEEGGAAETVWKLRGDRALAEPSCPLRGGKPPKAQVDVTFTGADASTRAFAYTCASDDAEAAAALSARARPCAARVTRSDGGNVKVEEWRLPGDVVVIDVAMTGKDAPAVLEIFRTRIVEPLLAAGVKPIAETKTDLGSRCP